jgi:hypothetical protein
MSSNNNLGLPTEIEVKQFTQRNQDKRGSIQAIRRHRRNASSEAVDILKKLEMDGEISSPPRTGPKFEFPLSPISVPRPSKAELIEAKGKLKSSGRLRRRSSLMDHKRRSFTAHAKRSSLFKTLKPKLPEIALSRLPSTPAETLHEIAERLEDVAKSRQKTDENLCIELLNIVGDIRKAVTDWGQGREQQIESAMVNELLDQNSVSGDIFNVWVAESIVQFSPLLVILTFDAQIFCRRKWL